MAEMQDTENTQTYADVLKAPAPEIEQPIEKVVTDEIDLSAFPAVTESNPIEQEQLSWAGIVKEKGAKFIPHEPTWSERVERGVVPTWSEVATRAISEPELPIIPFEVTRKIYLEALPSPVQERKPIEKLEDEDEDLYFARVEKERLRKEEELRIQQEERRKYELKYGPMDEEDLWFAKPQEERERIVAERMQAEAEEKARIEAEEKAKIEAEEKARIEAEEKAAKEKEEAEAAEKEAAAEKEREQNKPDELTLQVAEALNVSPEEIGAVVEATFVDSGALLQDIIEQQCMPVDTEIESAVGLPAEPATVADVVSAVAEGIKDAIDAGVQKTDAVLQVALGAVLERELELADASQVGVDSNDAPKRKRRSRRGSKKQEVAKGEGERAQEAVAQVEEKIEELAEKAKATVDEGARKVADVANAAVESYAQGKRRAEDLVEGARDAMESVKSKAEAAFEESIAPTADAARIVKSVAREGYDAVASVVEVAKEAGISGVIEGARDKAEVTVQRIWEKAENVSRAAAEKAEEVKELAQDTLSDAQDLAKVRLSEAGGAIHNKAAQLKDGYDSSVVSYVDFKQQAAAGRGPSIMDLAFTTVAAHSWLASWVIPGAGAPRTAEERQELEQIARLEREARFAASNSCGLGEKGKERITNTRVAV